MAITLQDFANGDTDYVVKLNNNNSTLTTAINALQTQKQDVSQKAIANGYAGLGADGKVPLSQLPDLSVYQLRSEKGVGYGYAGLDASGKVPLAQLPASLPADPQNIDFSPYQTRVEKGAPNGYCGLNVSGVVDPSDLPDLSATYQPLSARGAAGGYATLDGGGKVPSAQLPDSQAQLFIAPVFLGGKPGDNATVVAVMPSVSVSFASGFSGSRAKAGVAATLETVFTIKKNGSNVGTITFAASGTTGTFAAGSQTDLTNTDELTIVGPVIADATLADIRFTLHGTR